MALRRDGQGWVCEECGARHDGLITCFGPNEPYAWHKAGRVARLRGTLDRSLCLVKVDGVQRCFVRGHLRIPLTGHEDPFFAWNVWVQVDEETFMWVIDTWEDPERADQDPSAGALDTPLPYGGSTLGLPVELHHQIPGEVPLVVLTQAPDHPLQQEQEAGMTLHRLAEINALAFAG